MTSALRTLAFAALEPAHVWGAAWIRDPERPTLSILGAGRQWSAPPDLRLSAGEHGEDWRLDGAAAALLVSPNGDPVAVPASEDEIEGSEQLCRVTGRFEQTVDCLGVRSWWSGPLDLERYESVRAVSAWFEPHEGMTLTAFRPRKAKAHDRDVLAAAVITPERATPVEDPRLSTTYAAGGWPVRAGLELWLAGQESDQQYPQRASGEAIGARGEALDDGLAVRAEPFRWHSRGRDGAGMYLLASRR